MSKKQKKQKKNSHKGAIYFTEHKPKRPAWHTKHDNWTSRVTSKGDTSNKGAKATASMNQQEATPNVPYEKREQDETNTNVRKLTF